VWRPGFFCDRSYGVPWNYRRPGPQATPGGTVKVFVGLCFLERHWVSVLRDVSIVLLVVLVSFSVLPLLFLAAALIAAVNPVSKGVEKLLERGSGAADQVKGAASSMKGTISFVGERVASPFIRISASAAGIGEALVTFIRGKKPRGGSQRARIVEMVLAGFSLVSCSEVRSGQR
jgi:hypothetical protein